jgi:hypothetical protein
VITSVVLTGAALSAFYFFGKSQREQMIEIELHAPTSTTQPN